MYIQSLRRLDSGKLGTPPPKLRKTHPIPSMFHLKSPEIHINPPKPHLVLGDLHIYFTYFFFDFVVEST